MAPATLDILFASSIDKSVHPALVAIGETGVRLFTTSALAAVRDGTAAATLLVSPFAIAQGHAGIAGDQTSVLRLAHGDEIGDHR